MTAPGIPVAGPPVGASPGASLPGARDSTTLADAVAAAVLARPGVADLSAGPYGTVATLLPGRRIPGVQITDAGATVHIVVRYPAPVRAVAERVRAAVAVLVPGVPVHVGVDDVAA